MKKQKMTRYSDIAKIILMIIHWFNVFTIFMFITEMTNNVGKIILVAYLVISNVIVSLILDRFGKAWFK